jgi:hypothetical protein
MKPPEFATAENCRAKAANFAKKKQTRISLIGTDKKPSVKIRAIRVKVFRPSFPSRSSRDNLLIEFYLSFFDKKDLTNGIEGFISCAMNANEIPPKANARMTRIQKVSKLIRLFLQYGIPLVIIGTLGFGVLAAKHIINLPQPAHPHGSAAAAHAGPVGLWGVLTLIVYLFWYRTTLKLFRFFEKGILFTAETVRCIQILGVIYFVRFLVQLVLNFALSTPDWLGTDLSDLFTSFLMIFIGWLIDEARKIREQQELTV